MQIKADENFAKCGCGRTQDEDGLCDGSHGLTNEEYKLNERIINVLSIP